MSKLYRIKPLEWRQEGRIHVCLTDGRYRVWEHEGKFLVARTRGDAGRSVASIEQGKRLCEERFRREAARYLDPVNDAPGKGGK